VLTAALALVALPGLAGSHPSTVLEPLPAGAFQPFTLPATGAGDPSPAPRLDATAMSEGVVPFGGVFLEPGSPQAAVPEARSAVDQPESRSTEERQPPKYTIRGEATFYDTGDTAVRLPRGTVVVICGNGGCIERTVTDFGPGNQSRVADLYRVDFFAICGCPSWSGVTEVTVSVY
jgi:hypothetical protein